MVPKNPVSGLNRDEDGNRVMNRFLIVDDDDELRGNLREILEKEYSVIEASCGEDALKALEDNEIDLMLLDLMMPDMNGMEVLSKMKNISQKPKVIMITAFATISNAVEAIKYGASDYIAKPFKIEVLMTTIRRVIEEARFEDRLQRLDLDFTLSSLSNPIRRNILLFLEQSTKLRLMEICRKLEIEDHTKVIFHLKNLRENSIIVQNKDKSYSLTKEGEKTLLCLKMFTSHTSAE